MKTERWQQISSLFKSALERADDERAAFLAQACADDDSLRREVESLIACHNRAGVLIDEPAAQIMAELLINHQTEQLIGCALGQYQIISQLGAGGMGEVFLARDTELGRQIALKLLPAHFTADASRMRRFRQEARAASALNHPNILTIHEIGEMDARHFIVTEFIDGSTLRSGLGEDDQAFAWLERAYEERNGELVFLKSETEIGTGDLWGRSFRHDSRLPNLIGRVGLAS